MPESTTIRPEPVVTSEAPVSHISGAEVAQPYEMLGRALDKAGEGLEQLAIPLAERAGAQAVTRDEQGNIQVEHMSIFGQAGVAYGRAVKMAALAEGEGQAKRDDIGIREKYRDDPQGYQAAANAYKDKMVKQYTDAAGPEVGNALGRTIDSATTLTFRGLLNEKERLDLQRAENSINAGLDSSREDALNLARQGAPTGDPAMQQALGKYTTLLDEKARNPRLAYTQEQRALDLQSFQSDLAANRYLYHIDQTYKEKGLQAAEDDAKDVLTNSAYKLTDQQRESYYHRAVADMRANEAIRRQDIGQAQISFRELKTAVDLGQRVDPTEVEAVRSAFKSANYPAGIAMVDSAFAHKNLHDAFGQQPLSGQTNQLNTIRGAQAARDAYNFFRGRGYSDIEASGIVGNLVFESGLRPGVYGDQGTSAGIAQFHNERLAALKQYAASQGKPWTDFRTQLEFVDRELNSSESVSRGILRGAKTPEEAASIFAASYERPAGSDYSARQALARSIFAGKSADGSGGPGVSSWLIANRSATVDNTATQTWKQVMTDWQAGKGAMPSKDTVNDVLDAARSTGNIDLMAKVQRDIEIMDYVQRSSQLPLDQQAALETELRRRMAAGTATPGADLVLKQLEAKSEAITKGLQENPIATAIANFPDKFKTPAPLDFSDPQKLMAGLNMRAQIAQAAAQNWQSGPLSALDKTDLDNIKSKLNTTDPAVKAQIYGVIATLPEDVRGATLRKIGGNEPSGIAEAAAGSLMATDANVATSIFRGQTAIKADKRYDPEDEKGGKSDFRTDLDKAMPASIFNIQGRTDPSGPYATLAQMVRYRYADLSAQAGDTGYSKDRVTQAVNDVTGGLVSHNGGQVIAPARGMSQGQFDGILQGINDSDLAGVKTLGGQTVTPDYLRSSAQLENAGDGRYFVKLGRDPAAPIYAYQGNQKFILDLRNRSAVAIPPVDYTPGT